MNLLKYLSSLLFLNEDPCTFCSIGLMINCLSLIVLNAIRTYTKSKLGINYTKFQVEIQIVFRFVLLYQAVPRFLPIFTMGIIGSCF